MLQVLIEAARRRSAQKRAEPRAAFSSLLKIHSIRRWRAAKELARMNPRQAMMVRFFGGLEVAEIAAVREVSGGHGSSRLAGGEGVLSRARS